MYRLRVGLIIGSIAGVSCLTWAHPAFGQRRTPRDMRDVTYYSDVATTSLPMVASPLPDERSIPAEVVRGPYRSVQVNVDEWGLNVVGDAANEPSITVDPNDHRKMAIGWRQFNAPLASELREAGVGFTRDGGHNWLFQRCLAPGLFGSDPVLEVDTEGTFYYLSITALDSPREMRLFKSLDSGTTWEEPILHPGVFDKLWVAIDRTGGLGNGNMYVMCYDGCQFMYSRDFGDTFVDTPSGSPFPGVGTLTVGPEGEVYVIGAFFRFLRSLNAKQPGSLMTFDLQRDLHYWDAYASYWPRLSGHPSGGSLIGQSWIAADHSDGSARGNVYLLMLADYEVDDPYRSFYTVMFRRSIDRGETWSVPIRINDDPPHDLVFAWFPMMSVAPNGRIDVVWNDTRSDPSVTFPYAAHSELYYSYSTDAGVTWSPNEPVSPPFDHYVGYPTASPKLGDYYTMVSDNLGVNVAYAATFNGEQDIWFLRIGPYDCNGNDVPDLDDIANGTSMNCNGNDIPDECEHAPDTTGDGRVNLADYATLQSCFTGSGEGPVDDCCTRLDTDADSDLDLDDYPAFDDAYMK